MLDNFPRDFIDLSPVRSKYFSEGSHYINRKLLSVESYDYVKKQLTLEELLSTNMNIHKDNNFTGLLKGLLRIDPLDRFSAKKALKSSFFN